MLVLGGTGSFSKAFIARVLESDIERVCIYSRGEHAQAQMRDEYPDERLRFLIGDVRDRDRLRRAMEGVETVIFAAALKRIEVGQYNPSEMVKTNVIGAMNVIEAAQDAGVKKVVALSSDKAFQPISPYGCSKAMAESLFLAANNTVVKDRIKFSVTRYGNVAGSAGSIIPKWKAILENSDTVSVTNPGCTRFWMTMDEAVDLVLNTIEEMPTEVAIPVLPAFRVGDLAEAMGAKMDITGLPEWEKMHEKMEESQSSDKARRMSVQELKIVLESI